MKSFYTRHKWKIVVIVFVFMLISLATIQSPQASSIQSTDEETMFARLQDGLGSEAALPDSTLSEPQVSTVINSATTFLYKRSGMQMAQDVKTSITSLEYEVLQDTRRRLTVAEFSSLLSKVLLSRVDTLTDTQIDAASTSWRVTPDWQPSSRMNTVQLRASMGGELSSAQFATNLKAFRDQSTIAAILWRQSSDACIARVVSSRIKLFSNAVPSQWGGVTANGLTPLQAFIIAYSVISDDPLCDSIANVKSDLFDLYTHMLTTYSSIPGPENRFAFGSNGYQYASPLDIIFNDDVMQALVDGIDKGSKL
jgi:hypothetical protein